MKAVVRQVGTQVALAVGECGVDVDPRRAGLLDNRLQQSVDLTDHFFFAGNGFIPAYAAVEGKEGFDVETCGRCGGANFRDQFAEGSGDGVGRKIVADVVDAAEEEYLGRMAVCDRVETQADAFDYVAVDAAVFNLRHVEEFMPFATVGQAVSEKDDRGGVDAELIEERCSLIV